MNHSPVQAVSNTIRQWHYESRVLDMSVDEIERENGQDEEISLGDVDFKIFMALKFTRRDLPLVVERLVEFNRRKTGV